MRVGRRCVGVGASSSVVLRTLAVIAWLFMVAGCMPARPMTLKGVPPAPRAFVVDATSPDAYPGFGAAEGNIYSCRYGIAFQRAQEFKPDKARMFEALLVSEWPEAAERQVILHRFDVYDNRRLKMLSFAGSFIGGAVGREIAMAADRASGRLVRLDRLVVHVDPDPSFVPDDENPIGCNGRGEGEYFASQVSAGHSVVVTWLRFDVDGVPFHFRTFYPYQEDEAERIEHAKLESVRLSMRAATSVVREHLFP